MHPSLVALTTSSLTLWNTRSCDGGGIGGGGTGGGGGCVGGGDGGGDGGGSDCGGGDGGTLIVLSARVTRTHPEGLKFQLNGFDRMFYIILM